MLGEMQELSLNSPKETPMAAARDVDGPRDFATSFSSVLSALRAAKPGREERAGRKEAAWNDDALAEDVVALSYEKALRTHARYRPTDAVGPDEEAKPRRAARRETGREGRRRETVPAESKKTASVTIRMSRGEWEQLQARASEAKMSVSAYMRSCTLEVEALRAQVKETLARFQDGRGLSSGYAGSSLPEGRDDSTASAPIYRNPGTTLAELKQAQRAEPAEAATPKKPVKRETGTGWRAKLFPRWAQNRAAEA